MKRTIASLIVTGIMTTLFAVLIVYLILQGIDLEIHKNANSAPSETSFIPAGLFGIMLAPYIVTLFNHLKAMKVLKANSHNYGKDVAMPLLVGYILVIASILIVIVYLIFDGLLLQKLMYFNVEGYPLAIFLAISLLAVVPIGMIFILFPIKKKA